MKKNEFRTHIIDWYHRHKRELPWRKTKDPYKIWLSEIILQQTRVNQGLPYYEKFVNHYPSVNLLAEAEPNKVMKDWEGLGYYSRARNMHAAAKFVVEERNGVFPTTYNSIIELKGIGEYTAAAISSFAFGEAKAVLDGNVFRVLSRYFGVSIPINTTSGKKEFTVLAYEMLDTENPADYNQAIMEFGALQCVPKNPDCSICIFKSDCVAFKTEMVKSLPIKEKKNSKRERYFNFLMLDNEDYILTERREGKDIWQQLFQFPMVESNHLMDFDEILNDGILDLVGETKLNVKNVHSLKPHVLSHQLIHIRIFEINLLNVDSSFSLNANWRLKADLSELAFPKPLREFLDRNQLTLPFD